MVSTYTTNLGLENPATGDQTNTWGNTENEGRTLVDDAVAGILDKDVSGGSDVTLSSTQGVANEWRNWIWIFDGVLTGNISILTPAGLTGPRLVINNTTGSFTLTVKVSGGSGVTVDQGTAALVYSDGANVNTGLFGLVPPLSITQGGTSATTAPTARTALGLGTAATADTGTGGANVPTGTQLAGTERSYGATQYPATVTVAYAATVTLDLSIHQDAKITTAGNLTLALPTNLAAGITGNLEIVNGGTDTITFAAGWTFAGGIRPALASGAAAISLLSWRCNGTIMEAALSAGFA